MLGQYGHHQHEREEGMEAELPRNMRRHEHLRKPTNSVNDGTLTEALSDHALYGRDSHGLACYKNRCL